jgi:hypothetical protein
MMKVTPRVASLVLVLTLCTTGSIARWVAAATGGSEAKPAPSLTGLPLAGTLMVAGPATINGKKALSGSTIFSENRIAVANTVGNGGKIRLGRLGNIEVKPGTELVLRFADHFIGGELIVGEAIIRSNAGVKVALLTPRGLAAADGLAAAATLASAYRDPDLIESKTEKAEDATANNSPTGTGSAAGAAGSSTTQTVVTTLIGPLSVVTTIFTFDWIADDTPDIDPYDLLRRLQSSPTPTPTSSPTPQPSPSPTPPIGCDR